METVPVIQTNKNLYSKNPENASQGGKKVTWSILGMLFSERTPVFCKTSLPRPLSIS